MSLMIHEKVGLASGHKEKAAAWVGSSVRPVKAAVNETKGLAPRMRKRRKAFDGPDRGNYFHERCRACCRLDIELARAHAFFEPAGPL
ncbi:hypothetical protein MTO96_014988 [Rhipicephalus appendiculatus]